MSESEEPLSYQRPFLPPRYFTLFLPHFHSTLTERKSIKHHHHRSKKWHLIAFLTLSVIAIYLISAQTAKGEYVVYQMLSDYQNEPNGGNGWLRILTFDPLSDKLYVKTFSPWLNSYQTDENSQFTLDYPTNGTTPFTIIALPDTQYYSKSYPQIFKNQTSWIVENRLNLNVVFVVHLGDLVDQYNDATQWYRSKEAMSMLGDIPWTVVPGNHDFVTWEDNKHSYYYQFYGPHVFQNKPYYGGSWNDDNFNNYATFDYEDNKFLILNLQYNPPSEAIRWAYNVIVNHPDRDVILVTHEFVSSSHDRTPIGQAIWDSLVSLRTNQIKIVLSGHFNGEARRMYEILPPEREVLLISRL